MEKPQNGNRVRYNKPDTIVVSMWRKLFFIILPTCRDTDDCIFVSIDFSYEMMLLLKRDVERNKNSLI